MPTPEATRPAPALETRDLSISFGGHVAVNAVSCAFHPGTLTAIVGPNGAGKTTYFNLISGQLKATAGRVLFGGTDITATPPSQRARRGLGRAFQLTNLFPNLSVAENIGIDMALSGLAKPARFGAMRRIAIGQSNGNCAQEDEQEPNTQPEDRPIEVDPGGRVHGANRTQRG